MDIVVYIMLIVGIIIMVSNIWRYIIFLRSTQDVLSSGNKKADIWKYVALTLLIFFLCGYINVAIMYKPGLMVAGILFGGSIFVAIMLTNMFKLIGHTKERSIDISEVLIGVIEARDPNLNGHSRHVQELTMLIYANLPSQKKKQLNPVSLEYAALMHDVGKLGVPEKILLKPAKLSEDEWIIMRKHPKIGVKILKPLKSFDDIQSWIMYHHERIDGHGYYGLKSNEIPYASKIIAIADTYSAITMKRSYKPEKTHEEAIEIIKSVAGTQLDAELVDIFCSIPKKKVTACYPEIVTII